MKSQTTIYNLMISLLIFGLSGSAIAADSSPARWNITNLSKKAEQRSLKRFTLKEWMEGKEKRKMMDMWLNLNSPSPYEFALSGSLNQYSLTDAQPTLTKKSYEGAFTAYANFVGLTAEYQNNTEENFNDVTGIFNARIFGDTLQDTNFTLHYGLRTRTENGGAYRLNQSFGAASLQLYLTKFFGLNSQYRYYLPITESFYGDSQTSELTVGAFIDFDAFRIFGDYFKEEQKSKLNGVDSNLQRTGTKVGLKIFF